VTTSSFRVTVQDTIAPVLAVPADQVAEATSAAGATVSYPAATATDAVGVVSLTYSQASGTAFALGTTAVTVTARDAAGHLTQKSFNVIVRDTIAPVLTLPPTQTVAATSASGAIVTYPAATATDAVGVVSLTYSQASGTLFPVGTTKVTVTAKDAAGNTATGTFDVVVTPQVATCRDEDDDSEHHGQQTGQHGNQNDCDDDHRCDDQRGDARSTAGKNESRRKSDSHDNCGDKRDGKKNDGAKKDGIELRGPGSSSAIVGPGRAIVAPPAVVSAPVRVVPPAPAKVTPLASAKVAPSAKR
jgi:hypothetical protein